MSISKRKKDHIEICLDSASEPNPSSFDGYYFEHNALPEVHLKNIDTSIEFFNKKLSQPLLISSMTGGAEQAKKINVRLAQAAERHGIAFALGSQRAHLENPELFDSFNVRKHISSVPLFANIGAVNLNLGVSAQDVQRIVDSVEADGVFLHLNSLQEAVQEDGDTEFDGVLEKIGGVVSAVSVPVLVKEVGHGISFDVAKRLKGVGVKYVDVSGTGGTSWVFVEAQRSEDSSVKRLGDLFADWGVSTTEALRQCSEIDDLQLIAGGGVRSGLDVAKSVSLGASIASVASPFLRAAVISNEAVDDVIRQFELELKMAMFGVGASDIVELSRVSLIQK